MNKTTKYVWLIYFYRDSHVSKFLRLVFQGKEYILVVKYDNLGTLIDSSILVDFMEVLRLFFFLIGKYCDCYWEDVELKECT